MAEFQEVMKQAKRMCEEQNDCEECPIFQECDGSGCINYDDADKAETFEQKIMGWAAKHPEPRYPSWNEWQKANFPDACEQLCLKSFMNRIETDCSHFELCDECLNRPISADIAERLRIKPIGGNDA